MSDILTEAEIYQITAPIRQRAAQARHLSAMLGCPVKRRPDGLPIVTRAMLERIKHPPAVIPLPAEDSTMRPHWSDTPLGRSQFAHVAPTLNEVDLRASREAFAHSRALRRAALVRFHEAKRRTAQLRRTPPWANMDAIRAFYVEAQRITQETGRPYHVDHIIPLQGRLVSGLHVQNNLQILPGSENSKKRNRFEVEP